MLLSETPVSNTALSSRIPAAPPKARLLSARDFEWFLERERCLADRGTRLFTLMILRPRRGDRAGLERFSIPLRRRLRSTDLVGRLDADRLGVLLADTGPEGARVVADWVQRTAMEVGVDLVPTLRIYPSVPAPECSGVGGSVRPHGNDRSDGNGRSHGNGRSGGGARSGGDGLSGGDGCPNGFVSRRSNPAVSERANEDVNRGSLTRTLVGGEQKGGVPAPCAMEDLWPWLSIPSPLWKRSLDIVLSAIALLILLPLFVLVAIAIRLDSPGLLIFRQLRAGQGGRPFVFYKFRSMFVDAERRRAELDSRNEQTGPVFKIRNDPRITRVGRMLRRWSIDELPQFWNVLKGDFSLVGPRPATLDEVAKYQRWQRRRLSVSGGITGTWQVSGRSEIGFVDWMRMDMQYIARRSPWLDMQLLVRSVPAVLSGRGAY